MTPSEREMMRGLLDGLDADSPEPGDNHSHSYRHGFLNGRDDLNHNPRASAQRLRDRLMFPVLGVQIWSFPDWYIFKYESLFTLSSSILYEYLLFGNSSFCNM